MSPKKRVLRTMAIFAAVCAPLAFLVADAPEGVKLAIRAVAQLGTLYFIYHYLLQLELKKELKKEQSLSFRSISGDVRPPGRHNVRIKCKTCHKWRDAPDFASQGWVAYCAPCDEYTTEKEAFKAAREER